MESGAKAVVTIEPSWSRWEDARRALQAVREKFGNPEWTKPRGWIWHHTGERGKIQVVPAKLHASLPHTGGFTKYHQRVAPQVPRELGASPFPLHEGYPPAPLKQIHRFEELLGRPFPASYREFLLRGNGGQPRVQGFRGENGNDEIVDYFFSTTPRVEEGIATCLAEYGERLPEGMLPIAGDVFGNLICLGIEEPVADQVLFWDHELEPEPGEAKDSNITRLAPTFDTFLDQFFESSYEA
jgi:SMI1 / KNR4 family (SUKH-1)/A nuclease of the HNH/ENDO VII superfamily with conserved WHH